MKPKNLILVATVLMEWAMCCASAQTVNLAAGVYSFDANRFQSGKSYVGDSAGGSIIRNTSTAAFAHTAQLTNLHDVTIQDVTFDGNGIQVSGCTNVVFRRPRFINARRGQDDHQAVYISGSNNVTFDHPFWSNDTQAVQGFNCTNISFNDGRVEKSGYGIKWSMSGGKNLRIERMVFDRIRANMGIEIQNDDASIDGITITDVAFVNPELYADDSKNANATAVSVPTYLATNIKVTGVYADGNAIVLDANGNPTGERRNSSKIWRGLRVGAEIGGNKPSWSYGWYRNLNDPGAITSSIGAQVKHNLVQNCVELIDYAAPLNGAAARVGSDVSDNGPNAQLPTSGGWTLVGFTPPGVAGPTGLPTDPVSTPPPTSTPATTPTTGDTSTTRPVVRVIAPASVNVRVEQAQP